MLQHDRFWPRSAEGNTHLHLARPLWHHVPANLVFSPHLRHEQLLASSSGSPSPPATHPRHASVLDSTSSSPGTTACLIPQSGTHVEGSQDAGFSNCVRTMLIQHLPLLSTKRLVLASASPRRAELFRGLGLRAEVIPSTFDELLDKSEFSCAGDYAAETATHKAIEVSLRASKAQDGSKADVIIGADTVVEVDGLILEKPRDKDDAFRMLSSLSGRRHVVYTGVAFVLPGAPDVVSQRPPLIRSFWEKTEVEFGVLEEAAITAYIASGEPMDKAGAYGIQGIGGSFVKGIVGCYFNVMGLPVYRLAAEFDSLIKAGIITGESGQVQKSAVVL